MSKNYSTKALAYSGLFGALIFIFTFTFKIPAGGLVGYAHLGDMFIIVAAWALGRKSAPIAAGIGACLADIASGYAIWALPTFIIKFVFAMVICQLAERIFSKGQMGFFLATVVGAILHIAGYSLAWIFIGGQAGAIAAFIPLTIQTLIGLVLGNIVVLSLSKTSAGLSIQEKVRRELA